MDPAKARGQKEAMPGSDRRDAFPPREKTRRGGRERRRAARRYHLRMNVQDALKSQYHASLKTLRLAIEQCPEAAWNAPADGLASFWRVAYHALFYTHFYLCPDQHSFTPWARHQDEAQCTGTISREGDRAPRACEPYTREEILEYWRECDGMIDRSVDALDLAAPESGFSWYPMPKLEHQLVNIRHIQHHAAALGSRLRRESGIGVAWVGRA